MMYENHICQYVGKIISVEFQTKFVTHTCVRLDLQFEQNLFNFLPYFNTSSKQSSLLNVKNSTGTFIYPQWMIYNSYYDFNFTVYNL